jgi:hypothetical protein
MTDKQAYAAMFRFLERRYSHLKSDDLGGLLGEMALLADGSPADSATAQEWQQAVDYALRGGEAGSLQLTQPRNGVRPEVGPVPSERA